MDDESKEFQKKLAWTQIWSSAIITLGGVSFGSGISMWITVWTLIGTASTFDGESKFLLSLVDLFQRLGPLLALFGIVAILIGFIIPMLQLWPKPKKNTDHNTCHCGNKIPCSIHENKSTPI